jgi:hypothetical protein
MCRHVPRPLLLRSKGVATLGALPPEVLRPLARFARRGGWAFSGFNKPTVWSEILINRGYLLLLLHQFKP